VKREETSDHGQPPAQGKGPVDCFPMSQWKEAKHGSPTRKGFGNFLGREKVLSPCEDELSGTIPMVIYPFFDIREKFRCILNSIKMVYCLGGHPEFSMKIPGGE